MAFKIKDNLDLYGNQLLNFALQSDSGFPQSPQVGHMFNYTGTGVMANHAVMCVDETTKAFKALAFVDEIATNAEFVKLKEKVDLLIGDDVDMDGIIESWKEVEAFLAGMKDTENLMDLLNSKADKTQLANYLPLSGGILRDSWSGGTEIRRVDSNNGNVMLSFSRQDGTIVGGLGFGGIDNPIFVTQAGGQNTLLHSGNIGDYAFVPKSDSLISNVNADNYLSNGVYLNQTGNGSGNSNFPSDFSVFLTFTQSSKYVAQISIGTNAIHMRRKIDSWGHWMRIIAENENGNVLIGTTTDSDVKLFVSGDTRFDGQTRINGSMRFYGKSGISSDIYLNNQSVGGLLFTYSDKEPLLLVGSNIGVGTPNPQKKLHVVGDLLVEGNIIATKEVSAGGAGQEGESGDGGAEVIDKELAKGQSSYTIPNTIGRSAVAVSLYEWNANNGSWDMCLADISVKDATITVTFGSATSVNHKLVAVG